MSTHGSPYLPDADELLATVLQERGPSRQARLDELCARHGELAGILRRRYRLLQDLGVPLGDAAEDFPERVGDFRLLERLGSGGMGVVYRAEQISLGREVALKLIRPEQLFFPGARERFRREVEAVARLQHPGIVPVYTVGLEGDMPWFAMELVAGCTLAELLAELRGRAPDSLTGADLGAAVAARLERVDASGGDQGSSQGGSYPEACIRIARQVAEALDHAHQRGILHRDVKPSNIVLTADGRAMLLDFGLTSSVEGERITRSGSAVGTLHYMSPEQLQGRPVDARADVYALGVTLYELLVLQAPYLGEDRAAIERAIRAGLPEPIRARNRRVPPEAEQVCLKAMDPDPSRRYRSASALASDLQRVLERRPVTARPPGPLLRSRRWAQRQPALAVSLAGTVLLATGIPSALGVQEWQLRRTVETALAREKDAGITAREERDRARQRAAQYQTISAFLVGMFEDAERTVVDEGEVTAAALLAAGVDKIRSELLDQPATRAAMLTSLSLAHHHLGRMEDAERLAEEALAQTEALHPLDDELSSRALGALAVVHSTAGHPEEAERLFGEALELAARWSNGIDDEWVLSLLLQRGALYSSTLRFADAERDLRRVLAAPGLAGRPPLEQAYVKEEVGSFLTNRAQNLPLDQRRGAFEEAEPALREAVETLRAHPEAPLRRLGTALLALGLNVKHQGRLAEALACYREARAALVQVQGEDSRYLGVALMNEAGVLESMARYEEAVEPSRQGVEIVARQLPPEHPVWATMLGNLAGTLFRAGRCAEAEELYAEVIPLQEERLGAGHPALPASWLNLGRCRAARQDWDEAERAIERSLELTEAQRGSGHAEGWLARSGLVDLALDRGRLDEAAALLDEAETVVGDDVAYEGARHSLAIRRGRLLLARGDAAAAASLLDTTAAWFEERDPGRIDPWYSRALQGMALLAAARPREAVALLENTAAGLHGRLAETSPLRIQVAAALDRARREAGGGD